MSITTVQDIWLVIDHNHKEKQLAGKERTDKDRLPLGSKGLGRLSVHKLGNYIRIVTRSKDQQEVVVDIDWNKMVQKEFLSDALIDIHVRHPEIFTDEPFAKLRPNSSPGTASLCED